MRCVTKHFRHACITLDGVHDKALRVRTNQDVCICHAKIGIQKNRAPTLPRHGQSEIDREAGLADPSLATCYDD